MSTSPIAVSSVESTLQQFRLLLAEELRNDLVLSRPYRVRSTQGAELHWPAPYETQWGAVDRGVYLHFDEQDHLLYVGKAASFGYRLAAYVKHRDYPRDKSCLIIDEVLDRNGLSSIRSIPMPGQLQFLSPALEWFLIDKLNPPCNKQYRTNLSQPQIQSDRGSEPCT